MMENGLEAVLGLYTGFLGKTEAEFERDLAHIERRAVKPAFYKLCDIAMIYGQFLNEDRLRPFINYISRSKSRRLILTLADTNIPIGLIGEATGKLDRKTGRVELTRMYVELNKTYELLKNANATNKLDSAVNELPENVTSGDMISKLQELKRDFLKDMLGCTAEIPDDTCMEKMVNNVVFAYFADSGREFGIETRPLLKMLASSYLLEGKEGARKAIMDIEGNRELIAKYAENGMDLEQFQKGYSLKFNLLLKDDIYLNNLTRLQNEIAVMYGEMIRLGIELNREDIMRNQLSEQLSTIEAMAESYDFPNEKIALKMLLKQQIQYAKSLVNSLGPMEEEVTFYLTDDPLEAVHIGQFFGAMTSLAKKHNHRYTWASVMQAIDANKAVVYARQHSDGRKLCGNRVTYTDNGIMFTDFYEASRIELSSAWITYMAEFSNHFGEEVVIPVGHVKGKMKESIDKMVEYGRMGREVRTVNIPNVSIDRFLCMDVIFWNGNNNTEINDEFYVIRGE